MTDKLTIVINGLEYVAKSNQNNDLAQAESELSLIKEIAKLHSQIKELERDLGRASLVNEELAMQINDLEQANDNLTGEVQGMSMIINDLEQTIAELEEEAGLNMSKFNELDEALNDIYSIARQFA